MAKNISYAIFRVMFKERYKDPVLQLIIPITLVGFIYVPLFLERGNLQSYALVLSLVPMINISETLIFTIALRNIIFVFGDHLKNYSVYTYLTMPITRSKYFLFSFIVDVMIPYIIWIASLFAYAFMSGIFEFSRFYILLSIIAYTAGYLFSTSLILLYTVTLKSSGGVVLLSFFSLGAIFLGGGASLYYASLTGRNSIVPLISFMNPFIPLIAYASTGDYFYLTAYTIGCVIDFAVAGIVFLISYLIFINMEL
ncbi:MAG: hypothetical protein JZD40_05725 [Sulfolobus sp.]|nr:hypothetical protein [Sulfolobus sp.]